MTTETMREKVLSAARSAEDGRYLLHEKRSFSQDKWDACDQLVYEGLAKWDNRCCFAPCIRLTEKGFLPTPHPRPKPSTEQG